MDKHSFSIEDNEVYYNAQEQLIINQLVRGLSNSQIATKYNMGLSTVKNYITSILTKSNCASRALFIAQFYGRVVDGLEHSNRALRLKVNVYEKGLNEQK